MLSTNIYRRMKKVLFLFDAPRKPLLAWVSLTLVYSALTQANLQNDLILKLVLQLAAFDCFEVYMMRRIVEKVSASYRNEYGEELDDYTLNEAMERHQKSWNYLLIIGTAIAATFILTFLIFGVIEVISLLLNS